MTAKDKRVDEYISKSSDFAKPILTHLRNVVHEACPDVQETIKWGFPNFKYAGAILCSMAAFKKHCVFGFWLGSMMKDTHHILDAVGERSAMGHLGKIESLKDIPAKKILIAYIREAMIMNEKGIKKSKDVKVTGAKTLDVPDYFTTALKKNKKAYATFEGFNYSRKKDYVEWITEAKTDDTRSKRILTALAWLEEGKSRNWKYEK